MASNMLVLVWSVLFCAQANAKSTLPSFLFILGDDIGWADFGYNNGTAHTPKVNAWAKRDGTIVMQDFHSGGTVCSPTRATVLTGRNHFRDCVDYVYGCSDMTECVPKFNFAPKRTFTIGDAVRQASPNHYKSIFMGKWHLGSFYNDSEAYGGRTSSPVTHGFDFFNATVEVAPTATTNCECRQEWSKNCLFGHDNGPTHCGGHGNPGGGPSGCCFNYWWPNASAEHGVSNLTDPTPPDDSQYLADTFINFLEGRNGEPFLAQISFHNCHIPFIGVDSAREACANNISCRAPDTGAPPYTSAELDFYACLNELDASIGRVLDALDVQGYYDNTMIWFTTDNGPEENCGPEGYCQGTIHRPLEGPGSAGPLRGRKRDIYEGGHRVPGIISFPAMVTGNRVSWDTVITMDFLATVMDVLAMHNMSVSRPPSQQDWAFDGKSVVPILLGEPWPERGLGWMYDKPQEDSNTGYGFRYGKWKYVVGSVSCKNADCSRPQLYNLEDDLSERFDVSADNPEILAAIEHNFTVWYDSVHNSIANESQCTSPSPSPPNPNPIGPVTPSSDCKFVNDTGFEGQDGWKVSASSKEECCGVCKNTNGCACSAFNEMDCPRDSAGFFSSTCCHLKTSCEIISNRVGSVTCVPL